MLEPQGEDLTLDVLIVGLVDVILVALPSLGLDMDITSLWEDIADPVVLYNGDVVTMGILYRAAFPGLTD